MTPVIVTLPLGPSVNELHANRKGGGRRLTAKYKRWKRDAGWTLKLQKPPRLAGRVDVLLELGQPKGVRADADNKLKAPLDLLVEHGVLPDDSARYVRQASARWVDGIEGCRLTLTEAAGQRRTILTVRERECRFPIEGGGADMLLCGAPTKSELHVYCEGHCAIAYRSAKVAVEEAT